MESKNKFCFQIRTNFKVAACTPLDCQFNKTRYFSNCLYFFLNFGFRYLHDQATVIQKAYKGYVGRALYRQAVNVRLND